MKDILPNILTAGVMGAIVWLIGLLPINYIVLLFIQVLAGALIYFICSALLKNESFSYLFGIVKDFFKKRKTKTQEEKDETNISN